MAVTRDYTPDNFLGGTAPVQGSAQAPQVTGGGEGGGNALLQGSVSRTSGTFGRSATVKAGEDIRPALESLKSSGGGTLILLAGVHRPDYDIVGASKINIIGEGIDQTIIDFGSASFQIKYLGTNGTPLNSFSLEQLTVRDSTDNAGVYIKYCDSFSLLNVQVTSSVIGVFIESCQSFSVRDGSFDTNSSHGFQIFSDGSTDRDTLYFNINNTVFKDNTGNGFEIDANGGTSKQVLYFSLNQCISNSNTGSGFDINSIIQFAINSSLVQCTANENGLYGIYINNSHLMISNCSTFSNTGDGIYISGDNCIVSSCVSVANTGFDFNFSSSISDKNIFTGCVSTQATSSTIVPADRINIQESNTLVDNILGGTEIQRVETVTMKNGDSIDISRGEVVIFKSVADGDEVDQTTVQGNDMVFGVCAGTLISAGNYTQIQTRGFTKWLKVNGTTDIAVGDFLCTYTVAGISAKAGAGDMAFAIALEAYTANDSDGVIDALLISPRKI